MTNQIKYNIRYRPFIEVSTDDTNRPEIKPNITSMPGIEGEVDPPLDSAIPFPVKELPQREYFRFFPTKETDKLLKDHDLVFVRGVSGFTILFKASGVLGEALEVRRLVKDVTFTFVVELIDTSILKRLPSRFQEPSEQHVYFNNFNSASYTQGGVNSGLKYTSLYQGDIVNSANAVTFKRSDSNPGFHVNFKDGGQIDDRLRDLSCAERDGPFYGVLELFMNVVQSESSMNKYVINLF